MKEAKNQSFLCRYRGVAIVVVVLLSFTSVLMAFLQADASRNNVQNLKIAVVLYGKDDERWATLDLGIRQACIELGSLRPVLITAVSPEEQIRLIQREINAGAEGLIVAATNSKKMCSFLEQTAKKLPVIMVESGAGENLTLIGADDEGMSRALAARVAKVKGSIVVLATELERQSVQVRLNALLTELNAIGITPTLWHPPLGQDELQTFMVENIYINCPAALVALDTETLETAIDSVETTATHGTVPQIFGIGSSNKILYALDIEMVKEICFQNEFNIGYIALMKLAGKMGVQIPTISQTIEHELVNHKSMYNPETERLLFPIIQ